MLNLLCNPEHALHTTCGHCLVCAPAGAGLVAVYDSDEDEDGPGVEAQKPPPTEQQQIAEAAEAAAVVQSYMKVVSLIEPASICLVIA